MKNLFKHQKIMGKSIKQLGQKENEKQDEDNKEEKWNELQKWRLN